MAKNIEERIKMVKAMEYIARQINDENVFDSWLTVGVADGDIEYGDLEVAQPPEEDRAFDYAEGDEAFAELMEVFLRCMKRAYSNEGLYCNGVVSNTKR